jgi:2',3'-cyclic-nucleotide 2'-phosphodiesterase/3'-nucleotidase/5'-nucleotidase
MRRLVTDTSVGTKGAWRRFAWGALALLGAACGGEDGLAGKDGQAGTDGAEGPQGAAGLPGVAGVKGDPGGPGASGQVGSAGEAGAPGADAPARPRGLSLQLLGRHSTGLFDQGAAEIVAYDPTLARVFVVNAAAASVDVLGIEDPTDPVLLDTLEVASAAAAGTLGTANSVAVRNGVLAVAVEAHDKTLPGLVAFYDTEKLGLLGTAPVGALPDMVTFSPDGKRLFVANEGEPSDDYAVDPEGSISIITVPSDFSGPITVATADFHAFDDDADALRARGVRIYGPAASVSEDLEPEYLAVSPDGSLVYATLQENNALAVVDVATASVVDILPLGFKNHALLGNEFDPSDKDGARLANWPVFGMYLPDAIAAYDVAGETFLVTANEGDVREWGPLEEAKRIKDLTLDPTAFPDAVELKKDKALGRLEVTTELGDFDDDGDHDALYAFGARSFSIWRAESGELVYDSGNEIELRTAQRLRENFNSAHDESGSGDTRSDSKGPEPEAVTLAHLNGSVFAFIALERAGGVVVYDVTLPESPTFVTYVNSRDFAVEFDADHLDDLADVGDLGPECSVYISAEDSPTGQALLVLGNEVSGTTAIFGITPLLDTP